jgi:hypothetical protein
MSKRLSAVIPAKPCEAGREPGSRVMGNIRFFRIPDLAMQSIAHPE